MGDAPWPAHTGHLPTSRWGKSCALRHPPAGQQRPRASAPPAPLRTAPSLGTPGAKASGPGPCSPSPEGSAELLPPSSSSCEQPGPPSAPRPPTSAAPPSCGGPAPGAGAALPAGSRRRRACSPSWGRALRGEGGVLPPARPARPWGGAGKGGGNLMSGGVGQPGLLFSLIK